MILGIARQRFVHTHRLRPFSRPLRALAHRALASVAPDNRLALPSRSLRMTSGQTDDAIRTESKYREGNCSKSGRASAITWPPSPTKTTDMLHLFGELFLSVASQRYSSPSQFVDHLADRKSRDARCHADANFLPVKERHGDLQPNLLPIHACSHRRGNKHRLTILGHDSNLSMLGL